MTPSYVTRKAFFYCTIGMCSWEAWISCSWLKYAEGVNILSSYKGKYSIYLSKKTRETSLQWTRHTGNGTQDSRLLQIYNIHLFYAERNVSDNKNLIVLHKRIIFNLFFLALLKKKWKFLKELGVLSYMTNDFFTYKDGLKVCLISLPIPIRCSDCIGRYSRSF